MNIKIKQQDITDCGAACLASVAAYYDLNVPVARIRQFAGTDKRGTTILGMTEAAQKLGFQAKGVKGEFDSISKIPLPAIAHVLIKEKLSHFVVLYKVTIKEIQIMDPSDGQIYLKSNDDFKMDWTGVLILLVPDENFKPSNEKVSIKNRFWELVRPQKTVLIQSLIGALIFTLLGLSTAIFVQKIVDNVLTEGNRNLLNLMGVLMLAILLLQVLIGTIKSIFTLRSGQIIDAHLILGYYRHLLKLPQYFFDTMHVGEIISRVNDAVKIRVFINDVIINLAVNFFIVLFSFLMMFTYYWKLALIMMVSLPLYAIIYHFTNQVNKKVQRKLMEEGAELESQLVESVHSVNTIKQFGLEEHAENKTDLKFTRLLKSVYKSALNGIYSAGSTEMVSRLFTIILLWAGASSVLINEITPGELLSFYTLSGYFTGPVSSLIGMNKTIQDAIIASDRLFEIMDLQHEKSENKIILKQENVGDIVFENVTFRYGSRATVFEDLNLNIPKGRFTAIVGESGSGKSTIISLIQNLYSLKSGKISIGGFDLQHISNQSLRAIIGVVPQNIDLFSGSIIENIAVGDYLPNMEKILKISSQLGITEFIESLPKGYYTNIGENGTTLSGGQRQRIAIARVLYRNPSIVLFDEATSSLDSVSESYVHKVFQNLIDEQKTIIVVAHRLSSIYHADNIVVMHKGEIVEEGVHDDLMLKNGQYYKLCLQQTPPTNKLLI